MTRTESGCVHCAVRTGSRRLAAIVVLFYRLALFVLAVAAFVLLMERVTYLLGLLLATVLFGATGHTIVRSFGRAWRGERR